MFRKKLSIGVRKKKKESGPLKMNLTYLNLKRLAPNSPWAKPNVAHDDVNFKFKLK